MMCICSNAYNVVFEILGRIPMKLEDICDSKTGFSLFIAKTENMNRLIKVARESFKDPFNPGYIFNCITGKVALYPSLGYSSLMYWYRITDEHYPIYQGDNYIGYMWGHEFRMDIDHSIVPKDLTTFFRAHQIIRHEKNYQE